MDFERTFRMTPQRQIILEELEKAACHPTADEIYEKVRRRLPRVSLGTIYRNLETMASQGLIQKLDVGGNQIRFDINRKHHYHLRCLQCGILADVSLSTPFPYKDMLSDARGFEVFGIRLEFLGLCPECRKERKTSCD